MTLSFSLGLQKYWNGLAQMQAGGLYWVNADQQEAAYSLCGQVLETQQGVAPVTVLFPHHNLICAGNESRNNGDFFLSHLKSNLKQTFYYQLADGKQALQGLPDDINRLPRRTASLMVLLLPATAWQALNEKQFARWMREMGTSAKNKNATTLIICYGQGINTVKNQLHLYHRNLYGLADLNTQVDPNQWGVSWWHNDFGAEANSLYPLTPRQMGWEMLKNAPVVVSEQSADDHWMLLAERSVLEGAPALSERWFLFDDNDTLAQRATHARTATVIFALTGNDAVETMARQIHQLRMQRGTGLKIVVREMKSSLRYVDQRLLQACGANLVVPHAARLSNFLTLLDDLQHLTFTRHVQDNIETLLDSRLPTHHKGYLPLPVFCSIMDDIWNHTSLTSESRGLLVSLRPAAGINPQQAMSLCSLRRDGDILTVTEQHLYLFLSNCLASDVENVLAFLFSLPVNDIFTNHTFWSQERDIQTQIRRLAARPPMANPVAGPEAYVPQPAEPPKRAPVHEPVPVTLVLSDVPVVREQEP